MATKIDDGGPAMPTKAEYFGNPPYWKRSVKRTDGKSLRDWFAGQATPSMIRQAFAERVSGDTIEDILGTAAERSYEFADALLRARTKGVSDG